jgi:calcineurin-like phosphoesterase family protein
MIWFTSDPHFGHRQILTYSKRPFATLEEMHETLIKNWNECVRPNDTIYVLGDMALCSFKEFEPIAKRLNGIKYLIRGNHDHYSEGQYNKLGFTVLHEVKMKLAGHMVRLSHYPYALPWYKRPFAFKSELRYMERRPPKIEGEWLLHGHSHVKYKKADKENRIHIGVDAFNFYPVSQREIESLMNKTDRKK